MNKKICVYTCITGDYDNLHEITNMEKGVDYICFTNNKKIKSNTWKIVYIKNGNLDNHHLSRKIKMLGHPIIFKNYDISVWMDASIVWQKSIKSFVAKYLKNAPFAAFKHSQRKTIQEEAIACLRSQKDSKDNILRTLSFLKSENFPDNNGLFEMTVFIKKHNDPSVIKTMEIWFDTNQKYSKRDQLSFMYSVWKTGLKINTINLNVWNNQWFYVITHTKNLTLKKCSIYYGNSNNYFSIENFYTYPYSCNQDNYSIKCSIPNDTNQIEIDPFDAINVLFKNIVFKPNSNSITMPDSIPYDNGSLLFLEHDLFRFKGNFKRGQTLLFSFSARSLNTSELYQIIQQTNISQREHIHQLTIKNEDLFNINHQLRQTISSLKNELDSVYNSKSWKTIHSIRKILPPYGNISGDSI